MAAEGRTSGKNSQSDQRQIQATSGGANSPTIGGDGQINTGTPITNSGFGDVNIADFGAIEAAFEFGSNVVSGVFAGAQANAAATTAANTRISESALSALGAAGAEGNNKTLLYIGLGAMVLIGVVLFKR